MDALMVLYICGGKVRLARVFHRCLSHANLVLSNVMSFFSMLPLIVVLPFLIYLPSCTPRTALFCLLAVTSLCSTAFIMRYLPLGSPHARGQIRQINIEIDGPVEMYLPYLNGAISGLLLL